MTFGEPLLVSQGETPDKVKIKILKDFFLSDTLTVDSRRVLNIRETAQYIIFEEDLPKLVRDTDEAQSITDNADSFNSMMDNSFITTFAGQFVLSGALSMLWNIFNTLQLIVALELFRIHMPANVEMMFTMIHNTVNFQIIPPDDLYDAVIPPIFDLPTTQQELEAAKASQDNAERENGAEPSSLGTYFSGTSPLMNVLFMVIVFTGIFALIAIVILLRWLIVNRCCRCLVNIVNLIERKLMFNAVLRAVLESFLLCSINMMYGWREGQSEIRSGKHY